MILRRFIYYCGKFQTDTINQTVFGKEFVKLVWGKWKLFRATLREISYVLRARAHLRALMTQKSCAVGMRNAKLGNHLKLLWEETGHRQGNFELS